MPQFPHTPLRNIRNLEKRAEAIADSPTFLRAYEDYAFLHREELRPVRLQLELLKPQMAQDAAGILSTVVVFGGARVLSVDQARANLRKARAAARNNPRNGRLKQELKTALRKVESAGYYEETRKFAALVSRRFKGAKKREFVIITGGGPGIMEAANRGAYEVNCPSVSLNITLPHEQLPNPYVTPELCFQFHYFAIRKMHFLMRAKAAVFFPGGFGTLDEMFETLTLVQTRKIPPFPIVLFGRKFWEATLNFHHLVEEGVVSPEDLDLFKYADDHKEAWNHIARYYGKPLAK